MIDLFLSAVVVTLALWGILAILGLSLAFWPLVGVGALVTVAIRVAAVVS
jgi:hypothetical protein